MTAWLPGQLPLCAVCGEFLVRDPAQYTCPLCDEQKPCPPKQLFPAQTPTRPPWMRMGGAA